MWRDTAAARAATANSPRDRLHMCLDGEPLERCDDHPNGCPPLTVIGGLEFRKFPARYLTSRVVLLADAWEMNRTGIPPRDDGSLHWPAPLVLAFRHLGGIHG